MIAGLQKMTLLDFAGKVACTVFLRGCNYRCPFCHNSGLLEVGCGEEDLSEEAFFGFLEKRKGILDGVCVSGGEPTVHAGLPDFLKKIKAMGYALKLDTNGSNPQMLQMLIHRKLVDYVAMDIKNCPEKYAETTGNGNVSMQAVEQSAKLLMTGALPYEFRTTCVQELHTQQDFTAIGNWLLSLSGGQKIKKYFLQIYTHRPSVLCQSLHAPQTEQIQAFAHAIAPFAQEVQIRGDA